MKREPLNHFYIFLVFCLSLSLGVFVHAPKMQASSVTAFQVQASDPGFTSNPKNVDKQWALASVGFISAWEKTVGSAETIVAVIDTGIDQTHEDLAGTSFVTGFDFINKKEIMPGANTDDNGHGTLIAGVLGASANNGKGVVGTNWKIRIMPIKALDKEGKGESEVIADAIVWASDHGANIINLSLGGTGFSHDEKLANTIAYAYNKGAVIVAAAGNDSSAAPKNLDQDPVFPICNDNDRNMVIGVTALDQNNLKPDFANFGRNCIDVAAPGRRILSTISVDPLTNKSDPNSYAYVSGTSLAAAFVSGQAALIKGLYPHASNRQIRDRILSTAEKIDYLNMSQCSGRSCAGLLGAGKINVSLSLDQKIASEVSEGDLFKLDSSHIVYLLQGGQKRPISPFVFNQRFLGALVKTVSMETFNSLPEGPYTTPLEGTLIKTAQDPTVYIISSGLKRPLTSEVFKQREFKFSNIKIVDVVEINSWVEGKFYSPLEGSLLKSKNSSTLYWVVGGTLHPVNRNFYEQRGLSIFPILMVPLQDLKNYNIGEAYVI